MRYRDYRRYKREVRRRLHEAHPNVIIVSRYRRKDVERWVETGLIDPPVLPQARWDELRAIPHAEGSPTCAAAELDDGGIEECLIFLEGAAAVTAEVFDALPEMLVPASRLRRIFPSPKKLPVQLEERMNRHGETHMGGMVVNFVLKDGARFGHASGNVNSAFVTTPRGYVPDDIVDVEFSGDAGVRQATPSLSGPAWKYCAFRPPAANGMPSSTR